MQNRYAIVISYSQEDEGFIAVVPELQGCSAFGQTEEEALNEVKVAIQLWLEAAKDEGLPIPKPKSKPILKQLLDKKGIPISHSPSKA